MYVLVPIESQSPANWRADVWQIAAKTLEPCYLGGWTACEYWDLTDQIFRDIVVFTSKKTRTRRLFVQDVMVRVVLVQHDKFFGVVSKWRDATRVTISDPSRTVIDVLSRPTLGGGATHVSEITRNYFASEHRDDALLASYALKLGNRAVFKRLGYLLEALDIPDAGNLIEVCRNHISSGLSPLDPGVRLKGRIVTRWHLRVNADLGDRG